MEITAKSMRLLPLLAMVQMPPLDALKAEQATKLVELGNLEFTTR